MSFAVIREVIAMLTEFGFLLTCKVALEDYKDSLHKLAESAPNDRQAMYYRNLEDLAYQALCKVRGALR